MKIKLIAAVDSNMGLARAGQIPWHYSVDLKHFRDTTNGHAVVMGNKTFKTLPHTLSNRINIVLWHGITMPKFDELGLRYYADSIESAVNICRLKDMDCYVIGGAEVYKQFLERYLVDECIISHIDGDYNCDLFLPDPTEYGFTIKTAKDLSPEICVGYYAK